MLGRNPISKPNTRDTYDVVEIFNTLQGEGLSAGQRATFIRLAGCNLQCKFCDTEFDTVKWTMTPKEIFHAVTYPRVVITGGEPLLWFLAPLIRLFDTVEIETNGTLNPGFNMKDAQVTCSPKTSRVNCHMVHASAWKYIIDGPVSADGLPPKVARPLNDAPVFVQPCDGPNLELNTKIAVASAMKHGHRLSLQLHKMVGLP